MLSAMWCLAVPDTTVTHSYFLLSLEVRQMARVFPGVFLSVCSDQKMCGYQDV